MPNSYLPIARIAPTAPIASIAHVSPARLWLLPLLAGAVPFVATLLAFSIAVGEGQFAGCNPLIDGCVSISRAARFGMPNYLFRALVLPAAVLQGLVWLLCGAWLRSIGTSPTRRQGVLQALGLGAAVFLILYVTFLGTDSAWYLWMRRFGIVFYFGFTTIAILIVGDAVRTTARGSISYRRAAAALLTLCIALLLIGAAAALAPLVLSDRVVLRAFENTAEWWAGVAFTLFFAALAALWRQTRFAADLRSSSF